MSDQDPLTGMSLEQRENRRQAIRMTAILVERLLGCGWTFRQIGARLEDGATVRELWTEQVLKQLQGDSPKC